MVSDLEQAVRFVSLAGSLQSLQHIEEVTHRTGDVGVEIYGFSVLVVDCFQTELP